ncbi:MAG: 2'-deoxycytidine 5'-triphosphate deaminase, partial [Planctomycetota bacterium]
LCQIRFSEGPCVLSDDELRAEHTKSGLLFDDRGEPLPVGKLRLDKGLMMGIALRKDRDIQGPVGYVARRYTGIVDMNNEGSHDTEAFFETLPEPRDGRFIVEPEEFYIFASKERIRVPRHLAAEMAAYDVGIGELRTNYAGFFDNGFGGDKGTKAVLEVRPHDVPFLLEDGQVFFKLEFFRTQELPEVVYGDRRLSSHYQGQGLKLSKHFRA